MTTLTTPSLVVITVVATDTVDGYLIVTSTITSISIVVITIAVVVIVVIVVAVVTTATTVFCVQSVVSDGPLSSIFLEVKGVA